MRRIALVTIILALAFGQAVASTHTLRLVDGRVVRGELVRATNEALWFLASGEEEPTRYEIANVVSILFATPGGEDPSSGREPVVIEAGTRVRVKLSAPVGTLKNGAGDVFFGTLVDDLTVEGNVVVPAGKRVTGRVRKVVKPRREGQRVALELILASVPVQGKSMPIVTDHFGVESDGEGTMNTTGPAGVEGMTLFEMIDGWNITIEGGTVLVFHLKQPLTVR